MRYHVAVHPLAHGILSQIRRQEMLCPGDRVGAAVSGGVDSVALLRLLLELRSELGIVLSIVHFNHQLRGAESRADQEFVAGLARERGLEFYCASGDVAGLAAERHSGVEAAAREMRYEFFRRLLTEGTSAAEAAIKCGSDRSAESAAPPKSDSQGLKPGSFGERLRGAEAPLFHNALPEAGGTLPKILDKIATGHTLDDQAETVLMRVIRGTGLRGLGGIYPRVSVEDEDGGDCGEIVRPLLGIRRRELEQYLKEIKQAWREDGTNSDSAFTRNRVRKLVLPLLEREFNPAVVENLAELAAIARDEEDYWQGEASGWLGTVVQWLAPEVGRGLVQIELGGSSDPVMAVETPGGGGAGAQSHGVPGDDSGASEQKVSLSRPWLLTEPRAVQRRVLKAIGEQAGIPLEFRHVEEILRFAEEEGPSGKELALPSGWKVVREPEAIVFVTPDRRRQERIPNYEYQVSIPGRVSILELETAIEVVRVSSAAEMAEYNPQQLLSADLLKGPLMVRNWRPGDRFWPAHTKAPKKVKELLQERHVAQPERRVWPVVLSGDQIVWMRGFPVAAKFKAEREQPAVLIREHSEDEE